MNYQNPTIPDVLLISLVGFITVFTVLTVLMGIIMLISNMFSDSKKKTAAVSAPAPTVDEGGRVDSYTGVKLIGDVSDKEAALLMAIVANNLDKPLDKLRFMSIKEVK